MFMRPFWMLFRISMITHIYISICSPVFIIPTPCFYTTIFIKYIYTRIFFSSCSWICRCRCMIFFRCYIYLIALISRYRLFFPSSSSLLGLGVTSEGSSTALSFSLSSVLLSCSLSISKMIDETKPSVSIFHYITHIFQLK